MRLRLAGSALAIALLLGSAGSAQNTVITAPGGPDRNDPRTVWFEASRRAVARHDIGALRTLLQQERESPVETSGDGFPLLMMATSASRGDVVKTLVEAGADRHATNRQGETAFDLAKRAHWGFGFALPILQDYFFYVSWPFRDSVQTSMMTLLQR